MSARNILQAAAGSQNKSYVDDVFSTYLYKGTGAVQTINNGIDLAGAGGLVWIKGRTNSESHALFDTARGVNNYLATNNTNAQNAGYSDLLTSFGSTGFTLGADALTVGLVNNGTIINFSSWTFRKAPKFFDVVTYTGDGTASRSISHSLGVTPGLVLIKRIDSTDNWAGACLDNANTYTYNQLSINSARGSGSSVANTVNFATSSVFKVGTSSGIAGMDYTTYVANYVNTTGATYVAYLFAHDTSTDGLIQCGKYVGDGSPAGPTITLGWEPQYLMIKSVSSTAPWEILDNIRGMSLGSSDAVLRANATAAELVLDYIRPTATGFQIATSSTNLNANQTGYIYLAIRRPNKTPLTGTSVYKPITYVGTGAAGNPQTAGFPVDMYMVANRNTSSTYVSDRLRGSGVGNTTSTQNIESNNNIQLASSTGVFFSGSGSTGNNAGSNHIGNAFRRAPGFFDIVCYNGDGVAGRTVIHNLGVAPELMIIKSRNTGAYHWPVYASPIGNTKYLLLNTTDLAGTSSTAWNNTSPSATQFTLGSLGDLNASGGATNYFAYLFASLPGISKVGSFTGNGTSQTIGCGFSTGARFILIKRTNAAGDWYYWDTARGIVTANDPHLSANTATAEVSSDDSVDPDASGFIVNQNAATNINVSGATYLYLAIA